MGSVSGADALNERVRKLNYGHGSAEVASASCAQLFILGI